MGRSIKVNVKGNSKSMHKVKGNGKCEDKNKGNIKGKFRVGLKVMVKLSMKVKCS
jgi:hypothetical protein